MEILGKEFRIVEKGLDPDEVVEFIKAATGSSEDAFQRLEQFSALQAAALTMDESIAQARQLAEDAKKRAEAEAQQEKQRTIEEARRQAQAIIDQAQNGSAAFVDSVRSTLIDAIDKAFEKAKEATSANLSDLSLDVQEEIDSRPGHLNAVHERTDAQQADTKTDPAGADAVSEAEAEPEEDSDSDLDLMRLRQSLTNLEASLTGLHDGKSADEHTSNPPDSEDEASGDVEGDKDTSDAEVQEGPDDYGRQYSGEVVVAIPAGAGESWMRQLRRRTLELPGVHIRAESGVDEKTTMVTLSVEEPVALCPILRDMPNVDRVVEGETSVESSGKGGLRLLPKVSKKSKQTTITVEFREDSSDITNAVVR